MQLVYDLTAGREYPSCTQSALLGGMRQGYSAVFTQIAQTMEGNLVLWNGKKAPNMTFLEWSQWEAGKKFSKKYEGEHPLTLLQLLKDCPTLEVDLLIGESFCSLSLEGRQRLYDLLQNIEGSVTLFSGSLALTKEIKDHLPIAKIAYVGPLSKGRMEELFSLLEPEQLILAPSAEFWQGGNKALLPLAKSGSRVLVSDPALARQIQADYLLTGGREKPKQQAGMLADLHTHSEISHDCVSQLSEIAKAEQEKGVAIMAVTDHCDLLMPERDPKETASASYLLAKEANKQQKGLEILAGIELGEAVFAPRLAEEILNRQPFDLVIGSIHMVRYPGWEAPYAQFDFAEMGLETAKEYLTQYFQDLLELSKGASIDILAHLTCPLRYINGTYQLGVDCKEYAPIIREILRAIIARGIALEVNTSCKGSRYDEWMPEEWILEMYRDLGGYLITLGSDSHLPNQAARYFPEALAMLKRLGFTHYFYWKERYFYPISLE